MTISPDQINNRSQGSAYSFSGSSDTAVKPCSGWVAVEACYTDRWATPLTGAPVRIADASGIVIDQTASTRNMSSYGVSDGDTATAPLVELGRFRQAEVQRGGVEVELVADRAGDAEAEAAMQELGAALTRFRDSSMIALQPWVRKWEAEGIWSVAEAQRDGISRGLQEWWSSESDFWGGVSEAAINAATRAGDWYAKQPFLVRSSPGWLLFAAVRDLFGDDLQELAEALPTIMAAIRKFATGIVDNIESAVESLMGLPGEFGELFRKIKETGQDWIERMVLIASETNAFEYTFHCCMAVVMNMTPNFWAEMFGIASGYLLPEVLIELILMVIGALSGGSTAALIAGRMAALTAKLTKVAAGARGLLVMLKVIGDFSTAINAMARIGRGLHKAISAGVRGASDRIVSLRHTVQQLEFQVDRSTLGINGGNIRIVRKVSSAVIRDGNAKKGWVHIQKRHMPPDGEADLFAPGTTREQLQAAADEIVQKGVRTSDPTRTVQIFERRMTINGMRARYKLVVDTVDDGVITMYPEFGGK